MVHTSVHLEFNVSMCGWVIGYRSTNVDLPPSQLPTNHHLHPTSTCLPYQNLGNGYLKDSSLASPGETLHHLPQKNQEYKFSVRKYQDNAKNSGATIHTYLFPAHSLPPTRLVVV